MECHRQRYLISVALLDSADELMPAAGWVTAVYGEAQRSKYQLVGWVEALRAAGIINSSERDQIHRMFTEELRF